MPITTHGVTIIEPTNDLGRSLNLVAMQKVEWHQRVFHLCGWHSQANRVLAEALQRRRANFENAIQFVSSIGSVVPQMGNGASRAYRPCIGIAQEDHTPRLSRVQDLFQRRGVFGRAAVMVELAVSIIDRNFVPNANAHRVGVAEIRCAVLV